MIVIGNNRDPSWLPEYVAAVPAIFRRYGGEYVDVAKRVLQFEGPSLSPNLAAIFSFPTLERVRSFLEDPEYKAYADSRRAGMDAIVVGFDTDD